MGSSQQAGSQSKHHVRFYIVMITLVIGAVLFLLLLNDSNSGFSVTSAVIGKAKENTSTTLPDLNNLKIKSQPSPKTVEELLQNEAEKSGKAIFVKLKFNNIPPVRQQTSFDQMELRFDDLTTTVKVNNDKLELNNLQEVSLKIFGFLGQVDFDSTTFSVRGKARRIEVNDVALSSDSEIQIAFDNLNYQYSEINGISIKELKFPLGDGELKVADKLSYSLEDDQIQFYYFDGDLLIDKNLGVTVSAEGTTRGISGSGSMLNLNLR